MTPGRKGQTVPRQSPELLTLDRMETPIGTALLAVDAGGYLRAFDWADYADRQLALLKRFTGAFELVPGTAPEAMRRAVDAYFAGDLAAIDTIPWRTGGTAFQLECWNALVPFPPAAPRPMRGRRSPSSGPRRCARWGWPMAPIRWA
jgi:methylated-DNA-[protein]-cysteine S-methyltransferase